MVRPPGLTPDAPAPASGDVLVPGTPFDASGEVPCTPAANAAETQCPFGIIRQGGGTGFGQLSLPDGTTRLRQFRNGTAVAVDAAAGAAVPPRSAGRAGDSSIVTLGDQRFVPPDAVIFGGGRGRRQPPFGQADSRQLSAHSASRHGRVRH